MKYRALLVGFGIVGVVSAILLTLTLQNLDVVWATDRKAPPESDADLLFDDKLSDKKPDFDPDLISTQMEDGRQLNLSAAVIRLDSPIILPDQEPWCEPIYASYRDTIKASEKANRAVLPSVNVIDGKAKQFDDGLFAALDLACYQGSLKTLPNLVDWTKRLQAKLERDEPGCKLPRGSARARRNRRHQV